MANGASVTSEQVLVLNFNYQPLNVTSVRRAVVLLCLGKVHVVRTDSKVLHSAAMQVITPTVVRLQHMVRRPVPLLRVSRKAILARDGHRCQYCGRDGMALTVDHVVPRERGGGGDWENLVTCCTKCNNVKGNRTPAEADMKLLKMPRRPKFIPYISYTKFMSAAHNPAWQEYLAPYLDHVS
jgi:5-methylcytosine-specific restriction endonuclease McrA